jgi:hypothetical protein
VVDQAELGEGTRQLKSPHHEVVNGADKSRLLTSSCPSFSGAAHQRRRVYGKPLLVVGLLGGRCRARTFNSPAKSLVSFKPPLPYKGAC